MSDPSNAKDADVRRLVDVIVTPEVVRTMVTDVTDLLRRLPDADHALLDRTDEVVGADPRLREVFVAAYDRHLTHEEVRALLGFYETGAGRKIVSLLLGLARATGRMWLDWHADEFMPRVQALLATGRGAK